LTNVHSDTPAFFQNKVLHDLLAAYVIGGNEMILAARLTPQWRCGGKSQTSAVAILIWKPLEQTKAGK
jgi:hypothetical protein